MASALSVAGVSAPVRAEQLGYRYPQRRAGLRQISLSVAAGEQWLIAGPSGCGKSTLARCLTGLIPHLYHGSLEGAVWLNGLRTSETPIWRLAEEAGLLFQNPAAQMLAHSVEDEIVVGLENLNLPRRAVGERVEEALHRFGLEPMRARSPQTLSGGEQQKLALAAIMARRPPVLVLDEPLSMLDATAAGELVEHMCGLAAGGTSLVVCEHREVYLRQLAGLHTLRLPADGAREAPSEVPPLVSAPVPPFWLEVSGLGVALGERPVLDDLNFSLAGGQVVAIVGRNGVGKTTLLRALAGLQPHAGRVSIDGQLADLGMVFQNAELQLFNGTVRDEILYRVADPDEGLYNWLLAALGLERYQTTPPLLLSEGEKKRVALATVLMRGPRHGLLLDEPSLGQDAAHKAMLMRLCRSLAAAGRLVVMTTHDLQLAAQADRLLVLGAEGFVAEGPPATVLRSEAPWRRIGLPVPAWVSDGLPSDSGAQASPVSEPPAVGLRQPAARGNGDSPGAAPKSTPRLRRLLRGSHRVRGPALVESSPLRRADPRVKLALSLCASLAVMLDLERLLASAGLYLVLLAWARLLPQAARQVWRLKWVLLLLFVVDWLFVSPYLAWIISLRLIVLAGVFALLFSTTTPAELRLVLEWARVPYRYVFSLTLAFQSVGLLDDEWRAIREAQRARGAWLPVAGWRNLVERVRDLVALAVPAVVLVTKLAWAMTEAAYARGFDSPHRRPYRSLAMSRLDWALLGSIVVVAAALLVWR